jgi:lipoate-protein ligase A
MAIDETLLESATSENPIATVRFYRFDQPTLTLGYRQRLETRELSRLRGLGVSVVRRMTGGRALLHQYELTYSVTAPTGVLFHPRAVKRSYERITEAIASALRCLGVPVDPPSNSPSAAPRDAPDRLPCLSVATGHEIYASGRKLVASAQRWGRRGFLQHGAILYRVDRELCVRVHELLEDDPLDAVGLFELVPPRIAERDLLPALAGAFEALFAEPPTPMGLTEAERTRSHRLTAKYGDSVSSAAR